MKRRTAVGRLANALAVTPFVTLQGTFISHNNRIYKMNMSLENPSTKLNYYVLDVFTDKRYKGNQLSVVHCDDKLKLNQYHAISREFGYSETSFVSYSNQDNELMVRSFTPAEFEVVGAGHNLLGAVC